MKTLAELLPEVKEWATRNFPEVQRTDPFMGIVEELGEWSHVLLKSKQGIRAPSGAGQWTAAEIRAAEQDAIADMTIFALDFLWRNGLDGPGLAPEGIRRSVLEHHRRIACTIGRLADAIDIPDPVKSLMWMQIYVSELFYRLESYCVDRQWSYLGIVNETWDRVKNRDWISSPSSGSET